MKVMTFGHVKKWPWTLLRVNLNLKNTFMPSPHHNSKYSFINRLWSCALLWYQITFFLGLALVIRSLGLNYLSLPWHLHLNPNLYLYLAIMAKNSSYSLIKCFEWLDPSPCRGFGLELEVSKLSHHLFPWPLTMTPKPKWPTWLTSLVSLEPFNIQNHFLPLNT
jgi:hypothetical protein